MTHSPQEDGDKRISIHYLINDVKTKHCTTL